MANKSVTAAGLGVAMVLVLVAVWLAALGVTLDGGSRSRHGFNGFGTLSLLPLDGLLLLTLVAYALALLVSHTRLALAQSAATAFYGLIMIGIGAALVAAGLAKFGALITLLFAFPFGTIVYFVKYACASDPGGELAGAVARALGGRCFAGVQLIALVAAALKLAALAALLVASRRFVSVRGLLILVALATAVSAALVLVFSALSDLSFLMHPADALLTAVLGMLITVYGVVTFSIALFGLALAIAGQVA